METSYPNTCVDKINLRVPRKQGEYGLGDGCENRKTSCGFEVGSDEKVRDNKRVNGRDGVIYMCVGYLYLHMIV